MFTWIKKLFKPCKHSWCLVIYSPGAYDEERYDECMKCRITKSTKYVRP